jgi:hypothetical protein
MIDVIEFIFSSFWHWLGTFILIAVMTRWRMVYINVSGQKETKTKTDSSPSTFWKDLSDIGKSKPDSDLPK